MKLNNQLTLQRLVGKIDNDFNLSESDWIPRVAAWVTDALSIMQILPMDKKKRTLEVSERVAQFPCELVATSLKVFDANGNEIPEYDSNKDCGKGNSRFGRCGCGSQVGAVPYAVVEGDDTISSTGGEIGITDPCNKTGVNVVQVANIVGSSSGRNFVLDCNNIELNFDADTITVESYEPATYYDDYYDCEVPYIYDDGILLEALEWFVLYKYLSRGSKHPVYDLKTNNQMLNPMIQWNYYRPKAINSVKKKLSTNTGDGWNNFFYNSTFRPRD